MKTTKPYFQHQSCYINFAEHLQNTWNPNMFFPGAPNQWSQADWKACLGMIKAFGFNCCEFWLAPTLFDRPALRVGGIYGAFAENMRDITHAAHAAEIKVKIICCLNTIGPRWYHACPNIPEDRTLILNLWRHWVRALPETDIFGIFPGDPGGCNRNGCSYETFIDMSLEVAALVQQEAPQAVLALSTWGSPFSGWGGDMRARPGWDGYFATIYDPKLNTPESPCAIWNGNPMRARKAMAYLLRRLGEFPEETRVEINLGFSPDGDATHGGDAREYAREIARLRPISTWDYSVSEGELVCYPHWRLPRMAARRREERSAAPYSGGICYTMTPRLNLLTLYAAGQFLQDPDADPDQVSCEFCEKVFGAEHAELGEIFEAFEVVHAWGYYPRRQWSKQVLAEKYQAIIDHLEGAVGSACVLPIFPDPETYRQDLLWFARRFLEMAGANPDRERIRKEYWTRALAIYDVIPRSADQRAETSARRFSEILNNHNPGFTGM